MDKVVLVTGASSGMGKVTAEFLSEKGFEVVGVSRYPEKLKSKLCFELIKMDVSDENSVRKTISQILDKYGRIDILINNAGVGITGSVEETPHSEIEKVFSVNFFGAINVIKGVLPSMRSQKKGLIINITSIAGYMGLPYRGIYSATKSALETLTEALRIEVKDFGIHVSNLAPGDYDTDIASRRYHAPCLEKSPYQKPYSKTLKIIDDDVLKGRNPIEVSEKIYKIIQSQSPNIHYKVGAFLQKVSVSIKQILPSKIFEKILIKHYKL